MIELIDFCKTYSSQKKDSEMAVSDVSFVCETGSITGLVGENGSGKSTIIKAITGNHYATSGKVFVTGITNLSQNKTERIDASKNPEKIKAICGYVPELPVLPMDETVKSFLTYAASLFRSEFASESEVEIIVQKVIKDTDLESVLNKKIKTLSKGFMQRVSFAQSLVSNPSVLVLDEPFSGLDPSQMIQMRTLILREAENKTVLISTHNLYEVHNLCTKILVMKKGRLVTSGTESEIIKNTDSRSFEEAFLKL